MNVDSDLAIAIITCMMFLGLTDGKKNVILVIIKDLRSDAIFENIGDHAKVHTPHIDRLASRSLVFRNAFAQQSVSDVSILSMLTGRRPQTFGMPSVQNEEISLKSKHRTYHKTTHKPKQQNASHQQKVSDSSIIALPMIFKENGFSVKTVSVLQANASAHKNSDDITTHGDKNNDAGKQSNSLPVSWLEVDSKINLPDDVSINKTLDYIDYQKRRKEKFFLSVVFEKPELPFKCPKEYFNLYPNTSSIYLSSSVNDAQDSLNKNAIPRYHIELNGTPDILQYDDIRSNSKVGIRNGTLELPVEVTAQLRRAYYACVSYVDAMVGRILDQLKSSGLSDDTVVALVGTRGIHLGEHGLWGGNTNFDVALHVPMMLHVPGQTDAGKSSTALVELIDLFPTLLYSVDLGTSVPLCLAKEAREGLCREGKNLLPLLNDAQSPIKDETFSQVIKRSEIPVPTNQNVRGTRVPGRVVRIVGYSIRTLAYRYTEWLQYNEFSGSIEWNNVLGAELYDHTENHDELTNLAFVKSYKVIRQILSQELRENLKDDSGFNLGTSITGYVVVLIGTCYLMQSCAAMLGT